MYEAGIFYEAFFYGLMDDGHDPLCDNAGVDRPDPDGFGGGGPGGRVSYRSRCGGDSGRVRDRDIKAQAVLARTYIYRLVDPGLERIREEELDIDCLSMREMEKKWGKEHFKEYYGKIRTAVQETEGLVAEYAGELIEPFYCEASAGKTRELATYPYIRSVESPGDLEAGEFLCVRTFTEAEFADKIGRIGGPRPGADGIAEKIQIIERDDAGYVKRVQIGDMDYSGDEVRDSLGLLSSCFHFSSADGKIRVSSKGIGSGYGFSQTGADAMEREQGSEFRELLKYYFQGIEIVKIAE